MTKFRLVSTWVAALVWLSVGVGCSCECDSNVKPKYTGPVIITEEIDPVENPLSDEPGAVEIPRDLITSMLMSGMLQIGYDKQGLIDVEFEQGCLPLLEEIGQALQLSSPRKEDAPPGFAVDGTNLSLEAVRQIHAVLVEKQPPRQSFQAGSEITLVFFSYQSNPYTQLHRVDRVGNRVEIRYRFVWSKGLGARPTGFFSLIQLGKLEAGEYHVNIVKSALERKVISPDYVPETRMQKIIVQDIKNLKCEPISRKEARKMVCNSFSFTVEEESAVGKPIL